MTYNKAAFKSLLLHEATGKGTRPPRGIQVQSTVSSAVGAAQSPGDERAPGTAMATAPLAGRCPGGSDPCSSHPLGTRSWSLVLSYRPSCNHTN